MHSIYSFVIAFLFFAASVTGLPAPGKPKQPECVTSEKSRQTIHSGIECLVLGGNYCPDPEIDFRREKFAEYMECWHDDNGPNLDRRPGCQKDFEKFCLNFTSYVGYLVLLGALADCIVESSRWVEERRLMRRFCGEGAN